MTVLRDNAGNPISQDNPLYVAPIPNVMQPVDIQSRYAQTIQTHNAVIIAPSGSNISPWIDCNSFDRIAFSLKSDANHSFSVYIDWSVDGVSQTGKDDPITKTGQFFSVETAVKARYFRLNIINNHTSPHTQ